MNGQSHEDANKNHTSNFNNTINNQSEEYLAKKYWEKNKVNKNKNNKRQTRKKEKKEKNKPANKM